MDQCANAKNYAIYDLVGFSKDKQAVRQRTNKHQAPTDRQLMTDGQTENRLVYRFPLHTNIFVEL